MSAERQTFSMSIQYKPSKRAEFSRLGGLFAYSCFAFAGCGAGQPLPRAECTTLILARGARENGTSQGLNLNIYNLPLLSAGCLREAENDRRKIIRAAEKLCSPVRPLRRLIFRPAAPVALYRPDIEEMCNELFVF